MPTTTLSNTVKTYLRQRTKFGEFKVNRRISYMKDSTTVERHQNNYLKAVIAFCQIRRICTSFYQISSKAQVLKILDTNIRSDSNDPEKHGITAWNDYLVRIKHFSRWFHNYKIRLGQNPFN